VALIVLVLAGIFAAIGFLEGGVARPLRLPSISKPAAGSTAVSGTWSTAAGSLAGYRIQQVLLGRHSTLTGRTSQVHGAIQVSGALVRAGAFSVNLASLTGSLSGQAKGILGTVAHPEARLMLTTPISLGAMPPDGIVRRYHAAGLLSMHGTTAPVAVTIRAERNGSSIYALARIRIVFSRWHIAFGGSGWLARIASPGLIEVLLHLTHTSS
jgi:polyisoprenoid-binding protein YceI